MRRANRRYCAPRYVWVRAALARPLPTKAERNDGLPFLVGLRRALVSTLVVARTHTRPRRQVTRGRKSDPCLSPISATITSAVRPTNTRNRIDGSHDLVMLLDTSSHLGVEFLNLFLQGFQMAQLHPQKETLVRSHHTRKGCLQLSQPCRAAAPLGHLRQHLRVLLARSQGTQHQGGPKPPGYPWPPRPT